MKHYTVNRSGQYIRKPNSTLLEAAQEVATALPEGRVIFSCPNYAVVSYTKDDRIAEVTVWFK